MYRSTKSLIVICMILAGGTTAAWWYIGRIPEIPLRADIRGSSMAVGLPQGQGGTEEKEIYSESVLLWDGDAQVIQFDHNGFEKRPIASITKLMTAIVASDYGFDWDSEAIVLPEDGSIGGKIHLYDGETVSIKDLWHASLMGSANNATEAMVRAIGVSEKEFVETMNRKAIELGLEQTEFHDVTGLDPSNVSTAYEVARLAENAFANYPKIAEATSLKEYNYIVRGSNREATIRNTNKLMTKEGIEVSGGKTGYLYEANFCLVVRGAGTAEDKIAVVLGSPTEWANLFDMKELLQK